MANGKVFFVAAHVHDDDGTVEGCPGCFADPVDVTDAVGALYDLCLSSMDYGSGFWSYEDAKPVADMAALMGYESREEIDKYRDNQLFLTERAAYYQDKGIIPFNMPYHREKVTITRDDGSMITQWKIIPVYHEHAFSTPGRCMWPECREKREGSSQ